MLQGQTSEGNWSVDSRSVLTTYIEGSFIDDADVQQALESVQLADGANRETIYLTLLAIYILQEAFPDYEDEWTLIVRKARTFLE